VTALTPPVAPKSAPTLPAVAPAAAKTATAPKIAPAKAVPRRRTDDDDEGQSRFRRLINSKWGQRILLPLGFLAISYAIYDQFFSQPSAESVAAAQRDTLYQVKPENVLAADQFWNTCMKNNGAGAKKFELQYVELKGKVRKVNAEKAVVVLESPNSTYGIACEFQSKEDVAKVKAGDQVTIQGEGPEMVKPNTDVRLTLCKLKK
jgi:hypothetical protein